MLHSKANIKKLGHDNVHPWS